MKEKIGEERMADGKVGRGRGGKRTDGGKVRTVKGRLRAEQQEKTQGEDRRVQVKLTRTRKLGSNRFQQMIASRE